MKLSIRHKIVILGVVVSVLAMLVALVVSYINEKNARHEQYLENINNTLTDVSDKFSGKSAIYDDYCVYIADIKNYIKDIYDANPSQPDSFDTPQEAIDYYQEKYNWIYAVYGGVFIMFPELAEFLRKYRAVLGVMDTSVKISDTDSFYMAYYDEVHGGLIYMVDDKFGSTKTEFIHFAGQFVKADKPSDQIGMSDYSLDGKLTKSIAIYDIDYTQVVAYVFVDYDYSEMDKQVERNTLISFGTLGGTSIILIILYAVTAHFVIVKNIRKLSNSAQEFTRTLSDNENVAPIDPGIKSRDELEYLSHSFVSMEEELINYINVVKDEAAKKERMNAELNVASKIQIEALPAFAMDDENVSVRAFIKPAKEVGGDFYDYFYIDETHLAFSIQDVTGKGVPAALFMMRGKELLKSRLLSETDLAKVMYDVNNSLLKNNAEGMFITSFVGIIDLKKNVLTFVNAGHERPFIITKDGVSQLECNSNFILGGVEDFDYKAETIKFEKGTKILLHTDGLNESINSTNEEFGYERIVSTVKNNNDKDLDTIISSLIDSLTEFVGDKEQFDDLTMIGVQLAGEKKLNFKYENPQMEVIEEINNKFNDTFASLDTYFKSQVNIIIDELVNNVVSYEKADPLKLEVKFALLGKQLSIEIRSNGEEYNPLLKEKKRVEKYSDDLAIGGFGVSIVTEMVDKITYAREKEYNVLSMIKTLK